VTILPRSPYALAALAIAASLIAACNGNDYDDDGGVRALPQAAQPDANDEADAGELAEATGAFARADRETRERGLPSLYGDGNGAQAVAAGTSPSAFKDRFPGVKQTNLVASNASFGAAIVEPLMRNPWGIAIRPAGGTG
jgi:hypothetical protein